MSYNQEQNGENSRYDEQNKKSIQNGTRNGVIFAIFALLWQIAAFLIYGFFLGYNVSITTNIAGFFYLNAYVMMAFLIFMIAGFTLMSAYISSSSSTNMTFSILVALFTLQNWFIFRNFWNRVGIQLNPSVSNFDGIRYDQISFLPTGNDLTTSFQYTTASFFEAIGACIAMFSALSPLFGRIGFVEIFFLSWVGPFFYELNSVVFTHFYIVDNGFGMRGFLFGGLLGLFISLIIGKKEQTSGHKKFRSHYQVQALTLIGAVLVCMTYPNVISAGLLTSTTIVPSLSAVAQINAWFSLAGSIVGTFTACSLMYRHLYIHDIVFTSLSGAIAFSSSTTINYNPGAAIAIGSGVGFICSLLHTPLKSWMNKGGVRQSNSVIVQFIIPGIFACIMSSILQSIGDSAIPSASITANKLSSRTQSQQAGWQLMGFVFSLGCALVGAIIIGLIMKKAQKVNYNAYFDDRRFIQIQTQETVQKRTNEA